MLIRKMRTKIIILSWRMKFCPRLYSMSKVSGPLAIQASIFDLVYRSLKPINTERLNLKFFFRKGWTLKERSLGYFLKTTIWSWFHKKPEVEGHTINTERRKINLFLNRKSKDYNFYGIFGFEQKVTEAGRKLSQTFHVNHADDDENHEIKTDLVDIGSGKVILKKKYIY